MDMIDNYNIDIIKKLALRLTIAIVHVSEHGQKGLYTNEATINSERGCILGETN
jgi:hypothetical protein